MVICKNCGKDVEPVPDPKGRGPDKCPQCNAFIPTKKRKEIKEVKQGKDGLFHFNMGVGTALNSKEMQVVEDLVNIGIGENPREILKKGIYALAASYKMGGEIMQNATEKKELDDPEKEIDKLQARQARDAYLDELKEKTKRGKPLDSQEILDLVKQRQYMKMLEDMDKKKDDSDFNIKELMQLQMLQSLVPQNKNNNGNEALQKQIQDLQLQIREQKQEAKLQEMINRFESKLGQSKSGNEDVKTLKDFMIEIEKIREQGRTELEKERTNVLTEIEKRKGIELDHKLQETERKIQEVAERSQGKKGITKDDISDIRETITSAKELAKELGSEVKKGKDAGEVVTEIVGKTLENLTPIAKDYFQSKAQQPQQPIYVQQPIQPTSVGTNPENPQPKTQATPEEEMANMMHQQQNFSNKRKQ